MVRGFYILLLAISCWLLAATGSAQTKKSAQKKVSTTQTTRKKAKATTQKSKAKPQ